jgi:hypothetical protein
MTKLEKDDATTRGEVEEADAPERYGANSQRQISRTIWGNGWPSISTIYDQDSERTPRLAWVPYPFDPSNNSTLIGELRDLFKAGVQAVAEVIALRGSPLTCLNGFPPYMPSDHRIPYVRTLRPSRLDGTCADHVFEWPSNSHTSCL